MRREGGVGLPARCHVHHSDFTPQILRHVQGKTRPWDDGQSERRTLILVGLQVFFFSFFYVNASERQRLLHSAMWSLDDVRRWLAVCVCSSKMATSSQSTAAGQERPRRKSPGGVALTTLIGK